MENNSQQPIYIFPQETIDSLVQLGEVLRKIHNRMKSEGYDIIDDRIIHIATGKLYDSTAPKN